MNTHDWVVLAGAAMVSICIVGASRHLSRLLCMAIEDLDKIRSEMNDASEEIVNQIIQK